MGAAVPERAVRTVRWSREPEKQAWMEAHDRGQEAALLSMEFEGAFGFPLAGSQVSLWRSTNGRQARRSHGGGKPPSPVGSERDTGRGYVLVKVAEHPRVPQSKDNWRMKHVLAYERAHGPVPEGCVVVFADRDHSNFSPGNLVAVPRSLLGLLNGPGAPEWRDAETLSAAVAAVSLDRAIVAAASAVRGLRADVRPAGEGGQRGRLPPGADLPRLPGPGAQVEGQEDCEVHRALRRVRPRVRGRARRAAPVPGVHLAAAQVGRGGAGGVGGETAMRIGQDKLPPAIDLGRAVPDGGICRPRAKGELREPPDEVRREVVAMLQACSAPGRKGCETPFAQVVTALGPWWKRNQDSTLPEVLADLIAPRGRGALAAEVADKVGRLTRERDEAVAEAAELRGRAERAEAEADGLRRRLAKVGFLLKEDEERERR